MVRNAAARQAPIHNTAVRVEDVDFYYGQFRALKSINIDIQKNEVTALIGPSGCGKSTFLRLLNRMNDLIPNSSVTGKVVFAGQNIYEPDIDPTDIRRRIGMVFQKPNPFPKSIYNNVAYGPRLHAIRDKKILDQMVVTALKQAAIWDEVKDVLHTSAMELSGGQQQRLCIARALAMRPEILLMDEPTSALDPIATARIEELVKDLKKDYTVVIVTHNMQQAARVSDKTAFFYMGELIEFGPTEKLFTKPDQKQTEQYITGRFG